MLTVEKVGREGEVITPIAIIGPYSGRFNGTKAQNKGCEKPASAETEAG